VAKNAKRIEIGFAGGQVAAVRLDDDALGALRGALERGQGWHEVEAEDGNLALDLAQVVFVRIEAGEHSIGFSG